MKVTAIEQIEHSADITAEMVIAYALRHGWRVTGEGARVVDIARDNPSEFLVIWRDGTRLDTRVEWLARHENRKPHEVLADIAEGR